MDKQGTRRQKDFEQRKAQVAAYVEEHGVPANETFRLRVVAWARDGGTNPLTEQRQE